MIIKNRLNLPDHPTVKTFFLDRRKLSIFWVGKYITAAMNPLFLKWWKSNLKVLTCRKRKNSCGEVMNQKDQLRFLYSGFVIDLLWVESLQRAYCLEGRTKGSIMKLLQFTLWPIWM